MTPAMFLRNVELAATRLGGLVSPVHLHGMTWFENAPRDAVVIGATYGGSIGRAEFGKHTVLELSPLRAPRSVPLLQPAAAAAAAPLIEEDLAGLRRRSPGAPLYVVCEHELQAHFLRGLLGHAMHYLDSHCELVQAYTHPRVYGHMWSLHPACRTDDVYAELLERLDPALARMPWSRTNRALRGPTASARPELRPKHHDYAAWISGELFDTLAAEADPDWLAATGLFRREAAAKFAGEIRRGTDDFRRYEIFTWLATLRRFARWMEERGRPIGREEERPAAAAHHDALPLRVRRAILRRLKRQPALRSSYRRAHRTLARARSRRRYPPEPYE